VLMVARLIIFGLEENCRRAVELELSLAILNHHPSERPASHGEEPLNRIHLDAALPAVDWNLAYGDDGIVRAGRENSV